MPKQGFNNQWVAISRVGKVADNTGVERDLNEDFLKQVVANFTANNAPAVIGHPKGNNPAYGWVSALRLENNTLEAQFADTDDEFEQMCADGKFRKRSASFYIGEKPSLRHVGFLGAMPPAVKGLRDIQFNDGDSVTVEISFSEENTMKDEEVEKVAESLLGKISGFFKKETAPSIVPQGAATANFSETDVKRIAEEAAKAATEKATADFNEKYKNLEKTNKELSDRVNSMSGNTKRSEIASFCESIPAEKGKHFLKRAGIVDFMESLATADEADENPAINFSEGEGDQKVDHKFSRLDWFKNYVTSQKSFVEFGEKFGTITATAAAHEPIKNPTNMSEMRDEMGVKTEGGAK